jgi:hypothetical protein
MSAAPTSLQKQENPHRIGVFTVARPGLEPGTPRFSGSRGGAVPLTKDLQIRGSQSGATRRDGVGSGRFRGGLGLRRALEVPMSPAAPVTGWTRPPVAVRAVDPGGTRLPWLASMTSGLAHHLRRTTNVESVWCDARVPDPTRASRPGSSASRVCAPTALVLCHRERVERIESGWSTGPSGVDSHRATVGPTQLASDDM